ncbi:MAG: metallopeptidase TldD-related protein [Planctomycetota bacterium]
MSRTDHVTAESLLSLCDRALEAAVRGGAEAAEVAAGFATGSGIDFEKNDLAIAVSDDETSYGIRVIREGRVGFASSNDPEGLEAAVADALAVAASAPPDPHAGLPDPSPVTPVEGLNDPSIESCDVAAVTDAGARLLAAIRERDRRLSIDGGGVSATRAVRAIASTTGVRASEEYGVVGAHLFGMAVDGEAVGSFVVEGEASRRAADLEGILERTTAEFAEKALGALRPEPGESYRGPVLLSPEAVASLLASELVAMISAPTVRKGKSPLAQRLGEEIAHADFSLLDDPTAAGAIGSSAFDREGRPRRATPLVEKGVLRTFLFNDYEARAAGRAEGSTGHAAGGSTSLPGVGPSRLILAPGSRRREDLERDAGRCVVVTRFSGSTNTVTGEFSGVVKAGFLSRAGERRPVAETLISGNVLEALKQIAGVSSETRRLYGGGVFPWVLIDGISVTAG